MDILNLIIDLREQYVRLRPGEGIDAAIRHLKVAEDHFYKGRYGESADPFTDVVYRSNQAFEGALKEAYQVLVDKPSKHMSIAQIETHFVESNILHERVLQQFTLYRQNWRNESVHDHRLFFKEHEALLALTNVSAFCYVLLFQILEELARRRADRFPEIEQKLTSLYSNEQLNNDEYAAELAHELSRALPKIIRLC